MSLNTIPPLFSKEIVHHHSNPFVVPDSLLYVKPHQHTCLPSLPDHSGCSDRRRRKKTFIQLVLDRRLAPPVLNTKPTLPTEPQQLTAQYLQDTSTSCYNLHKSLDLWCYIKNLNQLFNKYVCFVFFTAILLCPPSEGYKSETGDITGPSPQHNWYIYVVRLTI